jgi:hypothetical protein
MRQRSDGGFDQVAIAAHLKVYVYVRSRNLAGIEDGAKPAILFALWRDDDENRKLDFSDGCEFASTFF